MKAPTRQKKSTRKQDWLDIMAMLNDYPHMRELAGNDLFCASPAIIHRLKLKLQKLDHHIENREEKIEEILKEAKKEMEQSKTKGPTVKAPWQRPE